jgi:uncharacterized iron-regulated membrane protein
MLRKIIFWIHLTLGVSAGVFIFVMAATGVTLAFERQITAFVDRDMRSVSESNPAQQRPIADLLQAVRKSDYGQPTAIMVRNESEAATQFSIGRGKSIYVDPYSGAILGASSATARQFFSQVERFHRAMGAPLGSKGAGHWIAAVSNLLFAALILFGVILWLPRRWSWKGIRASIAFRVGLSGRARDWNWHNVFGIWCAIPLLVIALTGVVMSFPWANTLLFRLAGSTPPVQGRGPDDRRGNRDARPVGPEPDYDRLLAGAKALDPHWRTITLNLRAANGPVQVTVDTGDGGQPQLRTQFLLNRQTGAVLKTTTFDDGSLGQRLRAFVRFGHTGEWGGLAGQVVAAAASLGACFLVYTGLALSVRRLLASVRRKRDVTAPRELSMSGRRYRSWTADRGRLADGE